MFFDQLAVIAIQLAAYAFMSLEASETHRSPPSDPLFEIWDFINNRFVFKLVFRARNVRKPDPKESKQKSKTIPKVFKDDFHENSMCAVLLCENNNLEVPNVETSSQESIKNT